MANRRKQSVLMAPISPERLKCYEEILEKTTQELKANPGKYGFVNKNREAERKARRLLKLQVARAQVQAQKLREVGSVVEIEREVTSLKNLLSELKKARKKQ